ncbi:MAG: large conductance mechanosensitive channel protein MscL [Actinomycetaceae bacterium]|nr:large conductance mechanosensitive channel protein MscL [Actinomycetaceae bacterium]
MIKGFKEFISQGNVMELAVGVIIAGAFSPIVDKVTKVILDSIGQIVGQPNFDSLGQFKLNPAAAEFIQPGSIVTAAVNFLIVAFAIYFFIVVPMNKLNRKNAADDAAEEAAAEASNEEKLLTEIRDLLAKR